MTAVRRLPILLLMFIGLSALARAADETPTVITSDSAEMVSSETESTITFNHHVVVTGTNLKITCDLLVVVTNRVGDPKATIGNQEKFKSLVATGDVRILQNDREATCQRAEVFPGEDKVVLTGHPRVQTLDGQYIADGPEIVLYRGQRRAVINGGSHLTLPPLKDLGYGKELEKNAPAGTQTPSTPAPKP